MKASLLVLAGVCSVAVVAAVAVGIATGEDGAATPVNPADFAGMVLVNQDRNGVALEGYDAVAYLIDNQPVPGDAKFRSSHDGAFYHFASAANQAAFDANPTRYAPAYGGYCGYAASIGKVRPANPLLWSIVDGRLIVQHTKGAVELWEKDIAGNKAKADRLWPRLITVKAGKKNPIDGLLGGSVLKDLN